MNIRAARVTCVTPHLGIKVLGDFGKVLRGCHVGGWLAAVRALRPQLTLPVKNASTVTVRESQRPQFV